MNNFEFLCHRNYVFQNLGNVTLFIADKEIYVRKSAFGWLAAKLWVEESTILLKVCTFE